jgi:hypothetical protein
MDEMARKAADASFGPGIYITTKFASFPSPKIRVNE